MDLLFLALLAGFILYKLFSVMGDTKYSDEHQPSDNADFFEQFRKNLEESSVANETVVTEAKPKFHLTVAESASDEIVNLAKLDLNFSVNKFALGVARAHEMIMSAFASGDVATLKKLLSAEVFETFNEVIEQYKAKGQHLNLTVVGITAIEITECSMENNRIARLTVQIHNDVISYITESTNSELVTGSKTKVKNKVDEWTFERDIKSSSNMWKLVETNA